MRFALAALALLCLPVAAQIPITGTVDVDPASLRGPAGPQGEPGSSVAYDAGRCTVQIGGESVSWDCGPVATPDFSCSFESSPTDCGFREQAKVPRATLVNVSREGNRAVRLRTESGDTNVNGSSYAVRNDLTLSQADTGCYEGAEQWWAHSILFPSDYVVPPSWGVAFNFHHTGSTGQANFHVDAASFGLRLRGFGGTQDAGRYQVDLGPVVRNQWYDFVYHVKWTSGADGLFSAWMNGIHVLNHRGPTLYAGMGCYLKLANYHTGGASSIIHDRVRRGSTAEAVAIGPLDP